MKNLASIALSLLFLPTILGAQPASTKLPLADGHSLEIINLVRPELHSFFDSTTLAERVGRILATYGVSSDVSVALNPNGAVLNLTVQGIDFDPTTTPKLAPVTHEEQTFLPVMFQKELVAAVGSWVKSFINNANAPYEARAAIIRLTQQPSPPRFLCSIGSKGRNIVVYGQIPALTYVTFDAKLMYQDFSAAQFTTIKMAPAFSGYGYVRDQALLHLENPDDPTNPTIKKDSFWIYRFFGLR